MLGSIIDGRWKIDCKPDRHHYKIYNIYNNETFVIPDSSLRKILNHKTRFKNLTQYLGWIRIGKPMPSYQKRKINEQITTKR